MRLDQITFTRFLAAFAIVVFHFGQNIFPFNNENFSFLFAGANLGVSYFFILSGFIMVVAYHKKSTINYANYYKNRIARIYPIYFLAIVINILPIISKINTIDLGLNLAVIQAWFPSRALSINGTGWSISVEFLFYALFPVLYNVLYSKKKFRVLTITAIIIIFIASQFFLNYYLQSNLYQGYPSNSHNFIFYHPLMHLNGFLMGNLAGLFFVNSSSTKTRNYDWIIILLVIITVALLKFGFWGLNLHNGLMAIVFLPLIVFISFNKGWLSKISKNKFLVFLGEISFGIYILQLPIFHFSKIILESIGVVNTLYIFYISSLSLIILSSVSYIYIETPLRNYIKKYPLNKNAKV